MLETGGENEWRESGSLTYVMNYNMCDMFHFSKSPTIEREIQKKLRMGEAIDVKKTNQAVQTRDVHDTSAWIGDEQHYRGGGRAVYL
ncbi:hypothetical protein GCM10008915_34910 [Bifidobacterium pullorum subsp. gallinarum]